MRHTTLILTVALMAIGSVANAQEENTFTNTVSGFFATWGAEDAAANSRGLFADCSAWLAASPDNFVTLDSIAWDLSITPQGASWYSEAALRLLVDGSDLGDLDLIGTRDDGFDSSGVNGIQFLPEDEFAFDGSPHAAAGSLVFDSPMSFSTLDFEFFETFDDGGETAVDTFISGSISVTFTHGMIPEPSSALLLAGLGLGLVRRRR